MSHPCPHWYRIMFQSAMTHLVPGSLRADLIHELTERGHPPHSTLEATDPTYAAIRRVHDYGLDSGGMAHMEEPLVGFRLHNLTLQFRCSDVLHFLLRAQRYEVRHFASGRPYYKHHGSYHALVFTPTQHRRYLAGLEALLPEAEATAHAFFHDKKSPIEILRDAQAKTRGVNPESLGPVASFGNSSADRFTNAKRGES